MIAITGANGNLGRTTLSSLLQKIPPSNIVAIVREAETIRHFREHGVRIRQADYNDYNSLKRAFENVEKALQISTIGVDIETAKRQEMNVVNAMAENQVKHILYTSMVQAKPNAVFEGTATHNNTEEWIMKTKISYTFFRNSMYMEYIPELIGDALRTHEIRFPSGDGKISYVSRFDIAEALTKVLIENSHGNRIYEITGSKAYTFAELAKMISTKMKHIDISEDVYREELIRSHTPKEIVDLLVSMARAIKTGEFSYTDNTIEKLLGRKSLRLNEFLKKHWIR